MYAKHDPRIEKVSEDTKDRVHAQLFAKKILLANKITSIRVLNDIWALCRAEDWKEPGREKIEISPIENFPKVGRVNGFDDTSDGRMEKQLLLIKKHLKALRDQENAKAAEAAAAAKGAGKAEAKKAAAKKAAAKKSSANARESWIRLESIPTAPIRWDLATRLQCRKPGSGFLGMPCKSGAGHCNAYESLSVALEGTYARSNPLTRGTRFQ